jgi:hypothetical protein
MRVSEGKLVARIVADNALFCRDLPESSNYCWRRCYFGKAFKVDVCLEPAGTSH